MEYSKKQGRIHGTLVADGWAGAVEQKRKTAPILEKLPTDGWTNGRTDGRTDGPTDQRTNIVTYRVA